MNNKLSHLVFALPQYLLPHHLLSRIMQALTHATLKTWKNILIRGFCLFYQVNREDAEDSCIANYASFNAFFTRALKPQARPLNTDASIIICPADGAISQIGRLGKGRILQAKGRHFDIVELIGGNRTIAEPFLNGHFATVYLSPRDYHRLHMPIAGTLRKMIHIPGRLFSVNPATTAVIPNLFARNERVVALFDTAIGPMALVLVGAIFVSSIETVWHGIVTPPSRNDIQHWDYGSENEAPRFERGKEMGRFNMGSTIIVLFGNDAMDWVEGVCPGQHIKMGDDLAKVAAV